MSKDYTCDIDRFSVTLESMFNEVTATMKQVIPEVVDSTCKEGVKTVKNSIEPAGIKSRTGKYRSSWTYKANKRDQVNYGEIGSRVPGLPHLLEKGHATLGGGRAKAYPHLGDAADEIFDDFEQKMEEAVVTALES